VAGGVVERAPRPNLPQAEEERKKKEAEEAKAKQAANKKAGSWGGLPGR
jgi:hypothetical protein